MSKLLTRIFIIILGIFLAAGAYAGGSGPCSNYGGWGCEAENGSWCFQCGEVVDRSCHLVGDMNCFGQNHSRHGLIIGAEGTQGNPIVIDGRGYQIDGGGVANRNCEVCIEGENGYSCNGPCHCADIDGDHQCDGCIDSGILNANPDPNGYCQGGFSFVTVKNLGITGWCDGIFMSGDCVEENERRLIGLLIEGNCIHDNGNPNCGTYHGYGDGGYWDQSYFNDGIFLAEIGLPVPCDHNDPNRVIIRHNLIYNQRGCIKWYAPGGNGIDYCSVYMSGHDPQPSGCSEIAHNICTHNATSGIMVSYYALQNRIHNNYCMGNLYGGIAVV